MELKILHLPLEIELEDENYINPFNINFDNNILTLEVTTNFRNKEFTRSISMDLNNTENKAFEVMLKADSQKVDLSTYEIYNFVHRYSGLKDFQVDGKQIAKLVIDNETNTVWLLLCIKCNDINGFENEILGREVNSTIELVSKCKWLQERVEAIKKKSAMINNVDYYNSISYLEAQVDLLTRIILSSTDTSELINLLKNADENSVLNIKPLSDIQNEFIISKANLRRKQEEYYNLLHGE